MILYKIISKHIEIMFFSLPKAKNFWDVQVRTDRGPRTGNGPQTNFLIALHLKFTTPSYSCATAIHIQVLS